MTDPTGQPAAAERLGPEAASRIVAMLCSADLHEESVLEGGDLPVVEGYRTVRRLGAGGGGTVFLAYREGSDRPLALKLLDRGLNGGRADSGRAWRELELLTQLRLPAVPRIIDYGQHKGRLFIATEFVEGLPLEEHCQQGKLDPRGRVSLLALVADAVQSLHEQGVMHRDIKPANILITPRGDPVIIDLGIAALLTDDAMQTLTAEGAPLGSPAFMAPEQARGDRSKMSTRTDVYGLGATACYILTGQTPYESGPTLHSALRRIGSEDPRDPRALDPSLPRGLAAVVSKAIAARPEDRYESAAAFGAELRRWLAGEPVLATRPGVWARGVRWATRHPVMTTAVACTGIGALILLGSLGSVWIVNQRPAYLEISRDDTYATLHAASGRELMRWGGGTVSDIRSAEIVRRPRSLGGGRLLIMAATERHHGQRQQAQLTVYSLSNLDEPLWVAPSGPPGIQAPANEILDDEYVVARAVVANVFKENPGNEIIAIHRHHQRSAVSIRIYSLSGKVLYEAWHLGFLSSAQWFESSGLLLLAGDRHGLGTDFWSTRGFELGPSAWPRVVFALRPEFGVRHNDGWINPIEQFPQSNVDVAWYRYLMPPGQEPRSIGFGRLRGTPDAQAVETFLEFGQPGERKRVTWLLDATGNFIPDSAIAADPFRRTLLDEFPPEMFYLADAVDVCGLDLPRAPAPER